MDLNKLYKEIEEAEVSLNAKRLKYIKEALAENCGGLCRQCTGAPSFGRSGGGRHRSPVESKSVRKRFANRWMS